MDITPFDGSVDSVDDAIVISVPANLQLGTHAAAVNASTDGQLQRLIDAGEISGKPGDVTHLLAPQGLAATHLVVTGVGEGKGAAEWGQATGAAVRCLTKSSRTQIVFALDLPDDVNLREAAVVGAIVASSGQDLYRAKKKVHPPAKLAWLDVDAQTCQQAQQIGEGTNLTRRLVNTPAMDMYPESFAAEALQVAETLGLGIEIWDEKKLADERCNAMLAVGQASDRPPRLVIMQYRGGEEGAPTLALVGKGVTFDSGGLSLKSSEGMKTMKCDMAGAATVLGAVQAIASLKLPINVIGVMGLAENMVGPNSYKLGDVLTARSGRTIEVLNTDAEGRLVLADALNVTVELGAAKIIDLATLTGACVVALGNHVVGAMTNDDAWCQQVLAAADHSGEYAWQLPMFPEYGKQIRSEIADIKNIGDGRWGGAITAAKFLEEFVDDVPWVHLDIAGPGFRDRACAWAEAGGSGVMVRSLVEVARRWGQTG